MTEQVTFKALAKLGTDTVAAVDKKLMAGESPNNVAKWMLESGMLTDMSQEALKKALERYRAKDLKNKVVNNITEKVLGKSTTTLVKQLNALDEMSVLVAQQKARFEKILMKEQEMGASGMLLKSVSDEARLLKELLVETGKLQLETGIIKRAPKSGMGSVTDNDGKTTTFTWTEEQERLYKTVDANIIDATAVEVGDDTEDAEPETVDG